MGNSNDTDQMLEVTGQVLLRCVIMGILALLIWWVALLFAGDLAYRVHSSFISITRQQFNLIHYAGMLTTKAIISLLFLFPYIAIRLVIRKRAQQH